MEGLLSDAFQTTQLEDLVLVTILVIAAVIILIIINFQPLPKESD